MSDKDAKVDAEKSVSTIENACYYISSKDQKTATFYDRYGNVNRTVPRLDSERHYIHTTRLNAMLTEDTKYFRPAKLKLDYHVKLGCTIYFYDKHGHLVQYQRYSGVNTDATVAQIAQTYLDKNSPHSLKCDWKWAVENNTPVENTYTAPKPFVLCSAL